MMNRLGDAMFLTATLASLAFAGFASAQTAVTMESLRNSYDSKLVKLQAEVNTDVRLKMYDRLLQTTMAAHQKAGSLDGVLAMKKEKERLSKERTVFTGEPDSKALSSFILEHNREWQQAETENCKKVVALSEWYIANLEVLKKQFTQQGKIDDAIIVRGEVERVRGSAEITSAQFTLADRGVDVGQPPPAAAATGGEEGAAAGTSASSAQTHQVYRSTRRIQARGDFNGDWIRTTMSVKKSDMVSIKASGKWKCPGKDQECGPGGYPDDRFKVVLAKNSDGQIEIRWENARKRIESSPYGSLLCKIGNDGKPIGVGTEANFSSEEEGVLFFDANVPSGRDVRQGSQGELMVEIEIKRGVSR